MRFLLDANMPRAAAVLLERSGNLEKGAALL